MDDDVYDVPPPSLPPKRATTKSSFRDVEGLSRSTGQDARPKPMPRRTLRKSSDTGEDQALAVVEPASPLTNSQSPSPKPVPRPRPRIHSFKHSSGQGLSMSQSQVQADSLPPSADEVEKMVDEMVRRELAEEEKEKEQSSQQRASQAWPSALSTETSSNGSASQSQLFSDSFADFGSQSSAGGGGGGVLSTNIDTEESCYDNDRLVKNFKPPASFEAAGSATAQTGARGLNSDDLFAGLDPLTPYAKVQRQKDKEVKNTEVKSDLDHEPVPDLQAARPRLATPKQSELLQPMKVWNRAGAVPAGSDAGPAGVESAPAGAEGGEKTPVGVGGLAEPRKEHNDDYEALWFSSLQKKDKPGMVRPRSQHMTFTPKLPAEGDPPSTREPVYGECSGEYIALDPTYNIPPPSLPPPPLPAQTVVRARPPSIPPRPPFRNSPTPADNVTFQNSSHLSESSTDESCTQEQSSGHPSAVFEELPTPAFNAPFQDDDPFKYSGFDTECQLFNTPLSTDSTAAATGQAAVDDSIYEVGDDGSFVVEWPEMGVDANDSTYNEIYGQSEEAAEAETQAQLRHFSDESFRLSQVPPPPPRPPKAEGTESPLLDREVLPPRNALYSLARADDQESSQSLDSSDSADDPFSTADFCNRAGEVTEGASGATIIAPPVSPRKNERYGYLYKQGGVKANRGWRLRWVVFNGKDLRYYDNNRSQISKKIIPLSSMQEVISDIKDTDTNRFKFRLVTSLRDRTFLFAADTRDDCCTWTSTLMAAILKDKTGSPNVIADPQKPDKEGFIRFENNNKKFYVAIWGKTLCYYDTFDDFQMNCPVHEIDMKLSSVKDKKKNRLQLSTHYAHFSLVFDSLQEAQSWRMAIEDAIAEGLADDSVLDKVYENDSNCICADCESENPHWASINLGIVLCKKCAGVHRMFETSVSKIRSLRMDTRVWTPSLIELMKAIGNSNANLFWEHDLLPIQKLPKDALPEERKSFAQLKYQNRHYSSQHPLAHDKRALNEELLRVSCTSDLLEAMKIIFSGADLSSVGGPEKENAFQTAKRHGQRLLMELLYQNGGDCSSTDEDVVSNEGRLREDVRLQGYLMKTGPASRTFDQRWCVLEHGALTYYLNEKSTTAKDSIDRKSIYCLQEIPCERPENVFEISTSKGTNRLYTFAADSASERGMWMRHLGKLISPVAIMEHVGMMDFSLAAFVFTKESVSEDWRPSWVMLSWRLLYFLNKDLKLDNIDLRKATHIRISEPQGGSYPMSVEKGVCFVLSSPGQTFYMQANLQRDTIRIFETISASMKRSGTSLLDQQLTADNVPVIVDRCLAEVYRRAQHEEGIYRKAATNSRVVKLIQELKTDCYAVRLDECDIHEVANSVKRFVRELDDSLFMRERYNEWIRTSGIEDHHNKFLWYRYLLEKLPLVNYSTLRRIVLHIWKMAMNSATNKMTIESLCTCFAPTLMRRENDTGRGHNPGNEIKVLLDLVSQRDYLFQIEQQELDQEAKIQEAAKRIMEAQQDIRKSVPISTFLMPVSMYCHSGQCEMVNTSASSSAKDVVDYLLHKCNLSTQSYALSEMAFMGALERPMFPDDNILMTTGRWADWDEAVRRDMCLCLTTTETLEKLDKHYDNARALFGEVKYADARSKSKFKKTTVEFKQCVLTFYKDAKAKSQLCSWKVEELTIYLGVDSKRSPPNSYGFTFLVNSKEEKGKNSGFGHCVCLGSEDEMYRWVSALLVAQNPEGLMVWNR